MSTHDVVIAGGGPTGLTLAGELALARVDVAIVERRPTQELAGSRAGGLHARTIEELDQRGIAERFVSRGQTFPIVSFGQVTLDIGDFPSRRNYLLALRQNRIEEILAEWVGELAVPIHRACDVTGFAQDDGGVNVALADGRSLRAKYLVGCDGGKSLVRKQAGIAFPGSDASVSYMIAEVDMAETPPYGMRRDDKGTYAIGKLDDGRAGVVIRDEEVRASDTPTLDELRAALVAMYGSDFGLRGASWLSRFSDATRQAASYRSGRVLIAGDAAHVHSPMGGQGLNLGVQDAMNLGWKLAQVAKGISADSLLDTYGAERHPVAARALRKTMAQTALSRGDERMEAVRETLAELLRMDEPRKRYAGMQSGLAIHHDLGDGHSLLGRRIPDLEIEIATASGSQRVFALLHDARPVLIDFAGSLDVGPWADRVQQIAARYDGAWELPVIGAVPAPAAVLIRPDGYVAWVGDGSEAGLREALTRWFGRSSL